MGDLIERSEALRVIGAYDYRGFTIENVRKITDGCKEAVAALPAAVVRCKDCEFAVRQESFRPGFIFCNANYMPYPLDGFCSQGVREGGEE